MLHLLFPSFLAGLLSFLAPCTLPLIPGYLGLISGLDSMEELGKGIAFGMRMRMVRNGLFFVLGFSFVFIGLGMFSGSLGGLVTGIRPILNRLAGAFLIIIAVLYLRMGFFPRMLSGWVLFSKRYGQHLPQAPYLFVLGVTFALSWTPCVGPILASVLYLASSRGTTFEGAFLLAVFALGLAIPFLAAAFLAGVFWERVRYLQKFSRIFSVISGLLLLCIGLYLLLDRVQDLYALANRFMPTQFFNYLNLFY